MLMKMMMDEQVHQEMMTRKLRPRLCYLTKGNRGYGFHLHGERRHGAQYIRRIEAGSPAELAGLRSGDRVVEVNGENVEKDSHQQVVQKIMAVESRTRLLVVDQETDDFLRHHFLPCTEDQAVESSCFLSGRRSRPASALPSSCNSLTLSLRSSTVSSRRHSGGSQNFSLRGSNAMGSCDSHLSSASRSAPPSPQESNNLGSCAPPSAQESDLLGSSDSAPPSPRATNTLGSCDSTVPSHQEYVTLGSCVSAPPSAQEYDTLGSSDSTPPSPMESTRLSSCDPTPSSSRDSDHPLILESSCDSAPSSPQDSNLASQTLRSFPLSSYDLNPPRSTPSPTYDVITLPSGRNEFYKTQTMQGAPIATHGNQETLGSQDATVTPDQRPRLCQVALGRQGFGFNLHCDRCREGQYIRSVDPDSPAERAGLVPGDRLIQVNEQRIEGLKHSEVVALIRGCGQETRLLVVDPETDALFRKLGITPTTTHLKEDCVDGPMAETRPPVSNGGPKPQTHGCSSSSSMLSGTSADPGSPDTDTKIFHAAATSTESPEPRQRKELWDDDLHLSPTAAEARQKVRSGKAKKAAPPMSWSKKYEVFSNF